MDFGLRPARVPDLHRENDRALSRIVVKDHFDRGVRINAAVPVRLSVDADRRKGRRNGGRAEHVIETDHLLLAVEIAYLAAAYADEAKRESRHSGVDQVEINELRQ